MKYFVLLILWTSVCVAVRPVQAQDCEDEVCIVARRNGFSVNFYVENHTPAEVSVRIDLEMQNMRAEVDFPYTATYPGRGITGAFTAWTIERGAPWRYNYRYSWRKGLAGARHNHSYAYALPFAAGTTHRVSQAAYGDFSHDGGHAIDLTMPEGTPVHAARDGIVVEAVDTYTEGGVAEYFKDKSNRVLIQHDDGTIAVYAHLMPHSVRVRLGASVTRGQMIGRSGSTGYASGPHLHFEVYRITHTLDQKTVPVKFRVEQGRALELRPGRSYTAGS